MVHHVRLQRAHEKERGRPWIAFSDHAGIHRAAEVIADDSQATPGRTVGSVGIERYD